jgi:hypothetical protein
VANTLKSGNVLRNAALNSVKLAISLNSNVQLLFGRIVFALFDLANLAQPSLAPFALRPALVNAPRMPASFTDRQLFSIDRVCPPNPLYFSTLPESAKTVFDMLFTTLASLRAIS